MTKEKTRLPYRLLTGKDDRAFCERVGEALSDGYVLYGNPCLAFNGQHMVAAQAVVLPEVIEDYEIELDLEDFVGGDDDDVDGNGNGNGEARS